jgi:hypothetical protein
VRLGNFRRLTNFLQRHITFFDYKKYAQIKNKPIDSLLKLSELSNTMYLDTKTKKTCEHGCMFFFKIQGSELVFDYQIKLYV